MLDGDAERSRSLGGHPQWRAGQLRRARSEGRIGEAEVLAVVGHGVAAQRSVEDLDRLAKPRPAADTVEEIDPERLVLYRIEAAANRGLDAAVGDLVDGSGSTSPRRRDCAWRRS